MMLILVFDAVRVRKEQGIESEQGIGSKVIVIVSPRRLYRSSDVARESCSQAVNNIFLSDNEFTQLIERDTLLGVTGGAIAMVELLMLRSSLPRNVMPWKRGETTASAGERFNFHGLTPKEIATKAPL